MCILYLKFNGIGAMNPLVIECGMKRPNILFMSFGFIARKNFNYFAFQFCYFERTWWRLFQKRVVRTKLDIYDVIIVDFQDILYSRILINQYYAMTSSIK